MEKSTLEHAFEKPLAGNFESYDTETLKGMYADYQAELSKPVGSGKYEQDVRAGKQKDLKAIEEILISREVTVE